MMVLSPKSTLCLVPRVILRGKKKQKTKNFKSLELPFLKFYLLIYFWLCWVFAAQTFSLVSGSRSYSLVAV